MDSKDFQDNIKKLKHLIDNASTITILSHLNPDPDALGTALGIYALLRRDKNKKVEVVNASKALPRFLDFLPYFNQIKHKINYNESLIISCDCGNTDRLGFDVSGREILNIDHHYSNTKYGSVNMVVPEYASSSQVAYEIFKTYYTIDSDAATCFYAALLSDTRYFTTNSVTHKVFDMASDLIKAGASAADISYHFTQRRSLASLRILQRALDSLTLYQNATIACMMITQDEVYASGAVMPDIDGVVDYARSLATVEIAICAIQTEDGIRISLRSKNVDVSTVALAFGGGGHKLAAGFTLRQSGLQQTIDTILEKIKILGLINEKNSQKGK
ncbi:MAG: bifunctional oligoribonuclease and phosphatase NrnA [Campylobacterota bacterium]|nr:bifunctional oligoribonuclease and phosphatase NrnA [Campylobacterota bacterium]